MYGGAAAKSKEMAAYGLKDDDYGGDATASRLRALAEGGSKVHQEALEAYEREADHRSRLRGNDLPQVLYVWPENRAVITLFIAMRHRWRVGMAGYVGLDLTTLPLMLSELGVRFRRIERKTMLEDLLILEDSALTAMQPDDKKG